jgi:hypothetical protein
MPPKGFGNKRDIAIEASFDAKFWHYACAE